MNPKNNTTKCLGKRRVFTVDKKMWEEFHRNVGNGARLSQFVGIWMLGLDVLPGMEDEQIHFFVYRSCDCLMDVWVGFKPFLFNKFVFVFSVHQTN